jgi:hypothetical protein
MPRWIKKYHYREPDILITQDYGFPANVMSKEKAHKKGLILFHGQWVTAGDYPVLRREIRAYLSVKVVSIIALILGLFTLSELFLLDSHIVLLGLGIVACAIGVGLWRYSRSAWLLGTLFAILMLGYEFIIIKLIMISYNPRVIVMHNVLVVLVALYLAGMIYLWLNRTTRKIFAT